MTNQRVFELEGIIMENRRQAEAEKLADSVLIYKLQQRVADEETHESARSALCIERDRAVEEARTARTRVHQVKNRLAVVGDEMTALLANNVRMQQTAEQRTRQIEKLREEHATATADLRQAIDAWKSKVDEVKRSNDELRMDAQEKAELISDIEGQLVTLRTENEALKSANAKLTQSKSSLHKVIKQQKETMSKLSAVNDGLLDSATEHGQAVEEWQRQQEQHKEEIARWTAKETKFAAREIDSTEKLATAKADLAKSEDGFVKCKTRCLLNDNEVHRLTTACDRLTTVCRDLDTKHDAAVVELTKMKGEHDRVVHRNRELHDDCSKVQSQYRQLLDVLAAAETKRTSEKEEMATVQKQMKDIGDETSAAIAKWQTSNAHVQGNINRLTAHYAPVNDTATDVRHGVKRRWAGAKSANKLGEDDVPATTSSTAGEREAGAADIPDIN